MAFTAQWTTRGTTYRAEVSDDQLLWGAAPAAAFDPAKLRPVDSRSFEVVSRTVVGRETVVTALSMGQKVTVVIPREVMGPLELAWKRLNPHLGASGADR
ncbi:hypothetical protein F1C15_15555 (plasmid) [Frigoribacterium sp. NBH87]|uniref:hypothetical protein n=1 Tax=Frigoribacterium sp. NBH87 TaxID=2596916 RepID=UPI0016293D04|nr:hypothetical protein [Frigoribacterium sp. NBH87]QNE45388.1 hypothetical protein F1C15_15555 [Frigoribacterium sp. NBH87]